MKRWLIWATIRGPLDLLLSYTAACSHLATARTNCRSAGTRVRCCSIADNDRA
jgi:hypothetical protein